MRRPMLTGALALGLFATGCGAEGATGVVDTPHRGPATSSPGSSAPGSSMTPVAMAKVQLAQTKYGKALTDAQGRTLYLFEKDQKNESYCTGACLAAWPAYLTQGGPQAGPGVKASLLGTLKRPEGGTQVSYGGHPLYYFVKDTKPGDANGQDVKAFGASWYVVGPDGKKIE